ncbi:MAG: outer membrane protein assembly factor BamD [Gemmataceae bacterium]
MRAGCTRTVAALVCSALAANGCQSLSWFQKTESPAPVDAMVMRDGKLQPVSAGGRGSPELTAAHELYRAGNLSGAESAFHKIAENKQNGPLIAEEARFYEAECLYRQDHLPKACDTYNKMLLDFPASTYRDQAVRRMFDIANYWLEDTRVEMAQYREKREGKRWLVVPAVFHFEKKKPVLDEEGRAVQALENVHLNDVTGPMADKALFLAGGVKFFREDYREADHYFTQVVEQHSNSPLAPQAVELAIIAKHMSTGGADYDGRKVAEARIMVDTALRNYPQLAAEKSGFLERQLGSITYQQAQKDFQTAEFYRRTKHPGSAYFYYEIVRRRYPGTKFAELATTRMHELRDAAVQGKADTSTSVFDDAKNTFDRMMGKPAKPNPYVEDAPAAVPPPAPVNDAPRSLPTSIAPR